MHAGVTTRGCLGVLAALTIPLAAAQPAAVPRNRTMTLIGQNGRDGRWPDFELWNAYSIGANHQNGPNLIYEPLAYYSAFGDKMYMWLAESYKFTPDFKQLTIKTRSGIKWSDGVPFSAEDVAYTLNTLREYGPKVKWGVDVQQALAKATATDANTVVLDFTKGHWLSFYRGGLPEAIPALEMRVMTADKPAGTLLSPK